MNTIKEVRNNQKEIEAVVAPPPYHWVGDGFRVHGFIPGVQRMNMQRMDPFLVMDYNAQHYFEPSETPRGVGVHPHKGFETVTIAYKGSVAHKDSSGGGGVIKEGDVQWMTAANGILHKEFHEKKFSQEGGVFQMVQLWVNLPAKHKSDNPKYQAISAADMSEYILPENAGTIKVVAGQYKDLKGPAETFTPIHLMNAYLNKGGKADFSFPGQYTTFLLAIEGTFKVNNKTEVPTNHLVLMKGNQEEFTVEAKEDSVVLVVSGQPLKEPIAAHGPFVMNTREELIEAFEDFNTGKFGYLE